MDTTYAPPLSLEGFLTSESFVSLVTGPVGSGKSSASMVKIAYHAQRMRAGKDGIRRSRAVIVRNTREMLRDSTWPTFNTWFPDGVAGALMKTDFKFYLEFGDVSCEVLFRGLDDSNDVRRLLSLEVSFGIMDEFREIHPDIFNALQGRVGRYPAKKDGGCVTDDGTPNSHIWGASNAPDADTFWSEYLDNPPSVASVFMQPSALSPEADWTENLIDGYYENIAEGKSQDWVDVYIHNLFGRSLSGQPVFRCFDKELHVSKESLRPNRASSNPILVGFDCTGLNPACAIGQLGFSSRLMIFDTLHSSEMGPLRFLKEKLKPLLANKFAGMPVLIIIDPAGMNRESDERSVYDMLKAEGLTVKPAKTNNISPRISAVEQFMTRLVDGKPAFVVDPGCTDLIVALRSKYRYKINTKGEKDDKPEKSHPWADIVDGLQYLCLHADGGAMFGGSSIRSRVEVKPAPMRWAA